MGVPRPGLARRCFLRSTCLGAVAAGTGFGNLASYAAVAGRVNERCRASDLKITDLRYAVLTGIPMARVPVIRIDTNQGIHGLGEVRDGASPRYALLLKSRLLGENPCDVDRLFRKIKQFGGHGRQGGGVSAVETALWDLTGKAYDVPVYRLMGGKFRDRIRLYADTPLARTTEEMARRLKGRLAAGFTVLKMDVGIDLLEGVRGAVSGPAPTRSGPTVSGVFAGLELTPHGIETLCAHVAAARESLGYEVPLALDHFGSIGANSCIRLGKALEKYSPAWLEDMVPWQQMELLQQITRAVDVPTLTGEDVYLKEDFRRLIDARAVDLIHPDLTTAGGLLETKKIGDLAQEAGMGMILHHAGSPVGFMASVHAAAATENFQALEFHAADVPFWEDLAQGTSGPLVDHGWAKVPDTPGLGVALNEKVCRQHLHPGSGFFEPTDEWNKPDSHDQNWS